MRPGDVVLVVLMVVAAAASMILVSRANAGEKGSLAVIEVNGKEVMRFALGAGQASRDFTVKGIQGKSTFKISDGRVRMVRSACRDRICVGVGWIDSPGKSIVCLPNRVVIRVTGKRGGGGKVDSVTE
ncbi:MAG TPA: NusG domain II-containing protein [Candidatus Anoxymicrobiaceae bacterium]